MKTIMNTPRILLLLVFILFAVACNRGILKSSLDQKNPTEYVFNIPLDSLNKTIVSQLDLKDLMLLTVKNKIIMPLEVSELISQSENNLDIFLYSIGVYCKSRVYKKQSGEFFDYWVSFYLHFEKIDESHTKVIIKTIEPKIIVRKELLPSPPHFVRGSKTIAVEPSTIEEYEILLEIGKLVGEKEMPILILPNEKSKIEIVKY